jgi:hypothetical protein
MRPMFLPGEAVLIEDGLRFDLAKTLEANIRLIDACAKGYPGVTPIVRTTHAEYDARLPWPVPGAEAFRRFWIGASELYDVIYEALVVETGPLSLKIFMSGMAWCEHRRSDDVLVTPAGEPISKLDPTPGARVYGPADGLESFSPASLDTVEAVRLLLTGPLAPLGLEFLKSEPFHISTDMATLGQFATVRFPHAVYGAGRGPIRVRCVTRKE